MDEVWDSEEEFDEQERMEWRVKPKVQHHNARENNYNWNGGIAHDNRRRKLLLNPNHPRANHNGYVFEHLIVAEKALGRPIPIKNPVHHVNKKVWDNRRKNLVLCESHAYHGFLHRRQRALKACGNVHFRPCRECKQYFDPKEMTVHHRKETRTNYICKSCNRKRAARWRKSHPSYWKKFYEKGGVENSAP